MTVSPVTGLDEICCWAFDSTTGVATWPICNSGLRWTEKLTIWKSDPVIALTSTIQI